jgi:hypothetical protein
MHQLKINKKRGGFFALLFISIVNLWLIGFPVQTYAEPNKISFDAQAVLPDNQRSDVSYYDLKVQPGAKQGLLLKLKNTTAKQIRVKAEANNAHTNSNGALDYSKHNQKLLGDPTFEDLISEPQTVTLEPNQEREVTFQLTIPKEGFTGTILGGFYCYEDTQGQENESEGFSLRNQFAYTIGVQLVCSDEIINPEFSLTKVKPGLQNGYLTVFATLENPVPVLMSQLDMTATVTKKGEKQVLREVKKKVSFAPRSPFKLPISWENEPLKKGQYQLSILLKAPSGKAWHLEQSFAIKGEDEKLNQEAVEVKKEENHYLVLYIVLVSFLMIILGLVWYIAKLRRDKR